MIASADDLPVACLAHFNLRWQPFKDQPRPDFVYTDSILEMPVRIVLDYLQKRSVILALTGEAGIGKTTQSELLIRRGGGRFDFLMTTTTPELKTATLDAVMRQRWPSLTASDRDELNPVLIVDDAHLLAPDALEALFRCRFEIGRDKPLGLVLTAETTIAISLSELRDHDSAAAETYVIQLRPYTLRQTGAYIEHRLRQAGLHRPSPFDETAITRIHRQSAGLPREINRLAREYIETIAARR